MGEAAAKPASKPPRVRSLERMPATIVELGIWGLGRSSGDFSRKVAKDRQADQYQHHDRFYKHPNHRALVTLNKPQGLGCMVV